MMGFFNGFEKKAEEKVKGEKQPEGNRSVGIPASIGAAGLGAAGISHAVKRNAEKNIDRVGKIKSKARAHYVNRFSTLSEKQHKEDMARSNKHHKNRMAMMDEDLLSKNPGSNWKELNRQGDKSRQIKKEQVKRHARERGVADKNVTNRVRRLADKQIKLIRRVPTSIKGRTLGGAVGIAGLGLAGYNYMKNRNDAKNDKGENKNKDSKQ